MDAEQVFKALADHHRRHLLDLLSARDGQSLNELCSHLPMSRIGVMKHLRILEQAGLITTRKVGRERLHYLNPAPIRSVAEWAERYRRHWDERMDRLELYLRQIQQEQGEAEASNAAHAASQVEDQSTDHRTDSSTGHSTGHAPESEREQDDNR
jgi:DNA-binding transcriptional ArsR family regulator